MRFPPMTRAAAPAPGVGYLRAPAGTGGVRPAASLSCLSRCVGDSTASRCGASCGGDLACWESCAPGASQACIAQCFRGG